MRPQPDSNLIVRPLATLHPKLFASPAYLREAGEPTAPVDLTAHQCIDFPRTTTWRLRRGAEKADVSIDGRVRLNSTSMAQRLACYGLGIVLIPEDLVADAVAGGHLQHVLPGWQGEPAPVFVLTESRLLPAKTHAFIAFMRDRLR
jgi:DNA-binding transcriptional LysR family regulator